MTPPHTAVPLDVTVEIFLFFFPSEAWDSLKCAATREPVDRGKGVAVGGRGE